MSDPTLTILIGSPCSGKSTWTSNQNLENYTVISTDNIIDDYARSIGKTYSEVYSQVNQNDITKMMFHDFRSAINNKENIIVDRTNMTSKGRWKFLQKADGYKKIAIVFQSPLDVLISRNKERNKNVGKNIPIFVIKNMLNSYQEPTYDEFDEIIYYGEDSQ